MMARTAAITHGRTGRDATVAAAEAGLVSGTARRQLGQ